MEKHLSQKGIRKIKRIRKGYTEVIKKEITDEYHKEIIALAKKGNLGLISLGNLCTYMSWLYEEV
jgi:hypothetical protein